MPALRLFRQSASGVSDALAIGVCSLIVAGIISRSALSKPRRKIRSVTRSGSYGATQTAATQVHVLQSMVYSGST
jgi:precorrin isomerase